MSNLLVLSALLLAAAAILAVISCAQGWVKLPWPLLMSEAELDEIEPNVRPNDGDGGGDPQALPLSWPTRIVATFVAILLLVLMNSTRAYAGLSPLPQEYFWQAYGASCLLIAWYLTQVWCYSVQVRGSSLELPNWGLGSRVFDLKTLQHIEDDSRHTLKLYFDDGANARVPKYVENYVNLREMLRGQGQLRRSVAPAAAI